MDKGKYFEKVKEYKLLAKHEVGQNFLCSEKDAERIVSLGEIKDTDKVLEIGSGAGSLSVFLADYSADSTLLDIDEGLVTKLQNDFEGYKNIHPVLGNALKADYSDYDVIIGNLPYYITSSLIEKIALEAKRCRKAVLMVQKEAFLRLSAKQGTDDYGPLPILLSYKTRHGRLWPIANLTQLYRFGKKGILGSERLLRSGPTYRLHCLYHYFQKRH